MTLRRLQRWPRVAAVAALLAGSLVPFGAVQAAGDPARIVAFGDVHGDADALVELLRSIGIVDEAGHWAAGTTQLVSLGDLLDRGPDSRAAMDLLITLQEEAAAAGGAVHVLLGNHEQMNLTGDLRYVAEEEFNAFAGPEDDALRAQALEKARALGLDEATVTERPAGFFAHRAAFGPEGRYAQWLLGSPSMLKLGDTMFLHAGLSPLLAMLGIETVNTRVGEGLSAMVDASSDPAYDRPDRRDQDLLQIGAEPQSAGELAELAASIREAAQDPLFGPDGPLWYRGNATCPAPFEAGHLENSLRLLGVERVVMGHTPQRDGRIRSRFDGRAILADTGMSDYYGGRPTALVIEGDVLSVQSPAGDQVAPEPLPAAVDGGLPREALAALLAEGAVELLEDDRARLTHPVHGRVDVRVLRPSRRERPRMLAARALDELLDLGMVPALVEREVGGRSVLLEVDSGRWLSEAGRQERGIGIGSSCHAGHPYDLVRLFDVLAGNARGAEDFDYRIPDLSIRLRNHEDAFGRGRRVPELSGPPEVLRAVLQALDAPTLTERLEPLLGDRATNAVIARRDALLEGLGDA